MKMRIGISEDGQSILKLSLIAESPDDKKKLSCLREAYMQLGNEIRWARVVGASSGTMLLLYVGKRIESKLT